MERINQQSVFFSVKYIMQVSVECKRKSVQRNVHILLLFIQINKICFLRLINMKIKNRSNAVIEVGSVVYIILIQIFLLYTCFKIMLKYSSIFLIHSFECNDAREMERT